MSSDVILPLEFRTELQVDALYLHAARQAYERATAAEQAIVRVKAHWETLEQEERNVLARHAGDALSAYDELEPISIRMESADYDIGEAHGPLVTEAATVHILCCAALEAHVNSVARSALSGHDYEVFEKWPPQTKWEYLPRLCGWGTFEIGGSPFQDFAVLVHYRNALLHYKKRSEPSVQGKEPAFIKDIGLTVAQAEQSIYAAESMISELARMRGVKAPYWLRRDLNEMSYWNVFLVLPRKCQRNRKLRPSGQRAPHSRTPPPKRKRHS